MCSRKGKPPKANPALVEYDDSAALERVSNRMQVREQERELARRTAFDTATKENHGGLRGEPRCDQRPEFGVRRQQDTLLGGREVEYRLIRRGLEAAVAQVHGVVTCPS